MQKLLKLSSSWYTYLVTAILIVVPLFPKFPAFRILGTYVAVRLEDFLILGTLLLFLVPILKNVKEIFKNNVFKAILLFLLIGLISLISGIYLTQTIPLKIGVLHWLRRVEYMSLFVIGFIYVKKFAKEDFFGFVVKVLLLVNAFVFLYGIGQRYFNFPVIITQNEEYSKGIALRWVPGAHINSTFAGHYDLASYLVLTIPLFVCAFFVLKDRFSKIILGLSIASGFWLFSVAVSRISILAFLVSVTVSLFLLKKYKEILVIGLISVVAFGFSPDLRARYNRIFEVVKEKISSVIVVNADEGNVNEDRSTSIRLNVEWPRALRAFYKNPILGTGYSSITLATDNDYLRALGETGVLGISSFILILISLFKNFIKYKLDNSLDSAFIAGIVGSFVGILITAIFLDIFEASKFAIIFWLLVGFVIAFISNKNKNYE